MPTYFFRHAVSAVIVGCLVCCFPLLAVADIFVPDGLDPGDTYHLIFATDQTIAASSTNIATYHAFAQSEAERNASVTGTDSGVQYFALAATLIDSDVRANAPITASVFNMGGQLVAQDSADMFDSSLDAPIGFDQFGTALPFPESALTGFTGNGTVSGPLISNGGLGASNVWVGLPSSVTSSWAFSVTRNPSFSSRIYAISDEITVASVPEPGAAFVCLFVGLVVALRNCIRNKQGMPHVM